MIYYLSKSSDGTMVLMKNCAVPCAHKRAGDM